MDLRDEVLPSREDLWGNCDQSFPTALGLLSQFSAMDSDSVAVLDSGLNVIKFWGNGELRLRNRIQLMRDADFCAGASV